MARGSIHKRCKVCRNEGDTGWGNCRHKEAVYVIRYRVGMRQKCETISTNKKDAERRLSEVLSQINNGTFGKQKEITFSEFSVKWLRDYAKPRIKTRTLTTYESTIRRHFKPAFGNYYLTDITVEKIQSLMARIKGKYTAKTANNALKMLKTIFKYARRWKYVTEDPTLDIDSFRVQHKEMEFLRPGEIRKFLEHASEPLKTFYLTAILTGMRKSELLALQWGDVDWNGDTLFVRRSLHWDYKSHEGKKKWLFDTPKTRNSVRAIVMSPKLKEALQIHKIQCPENEYDLVFANKAGQPLDPSNITSRSFNEVLRFAGLRKIRFHDLRHTYATLLINQGENIKFIQSQLGHASAQMTLDRYGHLIRPDNRGVGARLDSKVFTVSSDRISVLKPVSLSFNENSAKKATTQK